MEHNIRIVCVGEQLVVVARSARVSPFVGHPPPPQDARARPLIGRHYSKWRLRHIRSVLLATGKGETGRVARV